MMKIAMFIFWLSPCFLLAAELSPYAGEEKRTVKSLSLDDIASLKGGDGMGFAKLAELNHFPGPKHVLQLSETLELTASQLSASQALFAEMHSNAVSLGERLIEAESALDRLFELNTVNAASLESALMHIGSIRAQLRYVHLEAHLRQKELLTDAQVSKYDELRGYGGNAHDNNHHGNH